jgi:hypothetical protein
MHSYPLFGEAEIYQYQNEKRKNFKIFPKKNRSKSIIPNRNILKHPLRPNSISDSKLQLTNLEKLQLIHKIGFI